MQKVAQEKKKKKPAAALAPLATAGAAVAATTTAAAASERVLVIDKEEVPVSSKDHDVDVKEGEEAGAATASRSSSSSSSPSSRAPTTAADPAAALSEGQAQVVSAEKPALQKEVLSSFSNNKPPLTNADKASHSILPLILFSLEGNIDVKYFLLPTALEEAVEENQMAIEKMDGVAAKGGEASLSGVAASSASTTLMSEALACTFWKVWFLHDGGTAITYRCPSLCCMPLTVQRFYVQVGTLPRIVLECISPAVEHNVAQTFPVLALFLSDFLQQQQQQQQWKRARMRTTTTRTMMMMARQAIAVVESGDRCGRQRTVQPQ